MNLKQKLTLIIVVSLFILASSITVISVYKSNESLENTAFKQLDSVKISKRTHVIDYLETVKNLLVSFGSSSVTYNALSEFSYSFENLHSEMNFDVDEMKSKLTEHYNKHYTNNINFNLPNVASKKDTKEYLPKTENGLTAQFMMIIDNEHKVGEKDKLLEHDLHDGLYLENHTTHHGGFRALLNNFDLYDVFLVNKDGFIVYSVFKEVDYGTNIVNGAYKNSPIGEVFKNVINKNKGEISFVDFKTYEPSYNDFAAFISTPIFDGDSKEGALIFQISSSKINEIMSFSGKYKESGLGDTGEVFLVNEDYKMKNNSRFVERIEDKYVKQNKNTTGLYKVKNEVVEKALKGERGTSHVQNYLGEEVIAAYAPLKIFGKTWAIVAEMTLDEALKDAYDLRNIIVVVSLIMLILITLVLYYFINTEFIKPLNLFQAGLLDFFKYLNKQTDNAKLLPIKNQDEIGTMAEAVNKNIEKTKHLIDDDNRFINEVQNMINEVNKGYLSNRFSNEVQSENLEKLRVSFNEMLESLQTNIGKDTNEIIDLLNEFGQLNFTSIIKDDNGKIVVALNDFSKLITQMLIENKSSGLTLQNSSDDLLKNVSTLNINSNETAAALEETAASLEEITSITRSNSENVAKMANNANILIKSAKEGEGLATKTTKSMDEINEQVKAITEAISVIDQIAFQTNILSLNAAVEAATAGEAGKGFAVVAQEVRNLAARSAEAAKEIKDLVENANTKTGEGKLIADSMISGYSELNENIVNTIDLINDVETASKEQLNGIEQINDAVTKLDEKTQQNVGIANSAQDIARQTDTIATSIVDDANTKEFVGKDEVKAKN